jgi:hypothetical protein
MSQSWSTGGKTHCLGLWICPVRATFILFIFFLLFLSSGVLPFNEEEMFVAPAKEEGKRGRQEDEPDDNTQSNK